MSQTRWTVPDLEYRLKRAMNQEKKHLSLGEWEQADWCRCAGRLYRERIEVAKVKGYWEHEYESLGELAHHPPKH